MNTAALVHLRIAEAAVMGDTPSAEVARRNLELALAAITDEAGIRTTARSPLPML